MIKKISITIFFHQKTLTKLNLDDFDVENDFLNENFFPKRSSTVNSDLLFQSNSKFIVLNRIHFLILVFKIKFVNEDLKIDLIFIKSDDTKYRTRL